jgi:hypothetical protein
VTLELAHGHVDIDHPLAHGSVSQVVFESEPVLGLGPQQVKLRVGESTGYSVGIETPLSERPFGDLTGAGRLAVSRSLASPL